VCRFSWSWPLFSAAARLPCWASRSYVSVAERLTSLASSLSKIREDGSARLWQCSRSLHVHAARVVGVVGLGGSVVCLFRLRSGNKRCLSRTKGILVSGQVKEDKTESEGRIMGIESGMILIFRFSRRAGRTASL
jgi:hypothetical protein